MARNGQRSGTKIQSKSFNTKWLRNAAKSVGIGYSEALKSISPNLYETAAIGRDVTNSIVNSLKSNRTGQESIRNTLQSNKYVAAMQTAYKNAVSDIKSGNLAGSFDRPSSSSSSRDEDSGFSFGEEKTESPKMSESGAAALSINTQNQNIAMANIKMQKASMDATIALTSASMQQSATIGTEVINQLTNINSSLQALVQFNNENMNRLIESSTTYFEKAGQSLNSDKDNNKVKLDDVFNNNKGINIKNYKKYAKEQFKSMVNNSELGAAFQMLTSDAMLEGLASNPLGFAAQGLSAYLIPKMMRTSIETMEQTYNNYLPTLLTEIADLAEDESAGFAGKLRRAIGKTFGIKSDNRGKFNDHQVERGAISFDGETKHAITEIITKELRDQTGYLRVLAEKVVGRDYQKKADAGKEYWDYSTNSYIKGKDAINQNIAQTIVDSVTTSIQSTLFGKEFSKASLNSSDADSGVIDKAIEEVYFEMTRRSGNITEEMLTQIINSCHSDETVKKILRDHLKNMRNSNADSYNNMRFAQIKGRNAKSGVYAEIDKDQVGYNVNNSSYANRYKEDVYYKSNIKDPKTGKIIHNKGDLKHEKGERINADDITANTIFRNNKQTKVSSSQGAVITDNGGAEDIKGLIGTITNSMNSFISGVLNGSSAVDIVKNVSGVIGTHVDKIGDGIKKHLFGSDDGNGNKDGGIFSGISNYFKDTASSLKYFITGKGYTDSKGQKYEENDNSVLANLKNVGNVVKDGVMEKLFGKTKDENGEYQKSKEGLFGSIVDTFKQGFNGWMDAFFGEGTDGETPDERRKKMMQGIKDYTKENLPKAVAGGVVGAIGGGMMGSSLLGMLVGGPMFGAVAGAATGFLAKSKTFQNIVFGEEDENGERLGGLISKKTQDFVKENKNMLVGSAATGALTGGITGGGILGMVVGGPVAGALMGMATGIVVKSDKFQTLIFGEKGEDGKRSGGVIKNITDAFKKHFKGEKEPGDTRAAGMGAIGAGAGALTAAIVGKMGILGAALTPAGPIGGAIIGLGLGIKAAGGNFKEWLFGKKGGLDNLHGKSDKQGVIGQIGNTINANLLLPIKTQGTIFMKQLAFTMEHDIVKPIAIAGEAIADKAGELVSGLKETVGGAVKGFLENTKDVIFGKDDGNGNREGGILSPAINAVSGALNTAAAAIRKTMIGMISIPGRILRTGMSIVSSKIVEGFRTVTKPVRRLFKDIRTVIFSGIKGVFKLAFKGVGGIFKVASAPFRWVFGLGAAAGRSIKRKVSSFARKKLGDKADAIREKWAESGKNTGTILSRFRDNLFVAKSERAEDKEKLKKEIETLKRHADNAKYISRYTKGQFSVDTDEARDWLKLVNPRAYKKLISGKSLGKGYKGENSSVTEENERARIAEEGEDISGKPIDSLDKANVDGLNYRSKVLYFLKGIAGDTSALADETETGHKMTKKEKQDKKDNDRLEKDAKRLGITFDDDMTLAEKEQLVREKQAEKDRARKEKYKNKYKNNGEDEGSDEATGGPGLTEYLKGSFKGLKDWFFGYNEPGTKGKASTNGDIIQRTAAPVLEVGKDIKSALGKTWVGERLNAGIENVRSKEEELKNQGGNGTRIIYHKPLGGRGFLSTAMKAISTAGKAIGTAKDTASGLSNMLGGDSDTSDSALDSKNDGKSKGLFSKLAGGIGNSISSLFDKFSKSSDMDNDNISDEEEADERQSDENRRSSSRKRRHRGSKAKTRKDSSDATYATQEDIASEYSDKAEDMTQLANSRSKNAKQLQDQRKMEKQQEEQTRYAKISALASTAGSKATEKIQSMFSKIFSKDGLKIAGLAGALAFLNKNFPDLLNNVGDIAKNIFKFLGKNAEEALWTDTHNARTNGNSAVEEAERVAKNTLSGNILQLNADGSASSLTTPSAKAGARFAYDILSPNAKQNTHIWDNKIVKRRAKINKAVQKVKEIVKTKKNTIMKKITGKSDITFEDVENLNDAKKNGSTIKDFLKNSIKNPIKSQKNFDDILDAMVETQGYSREEALEELRNSMDEKDFKKFEKRNKYTTKAKNIKNTVKTKVGDAVKNTKTKVKNSKAGQFADKAKDTAKSARAKIANSKAGQNLGNLKNNINNLATKTAEKVKNTKGGKLLTKIKGFIDNFFETVAKKFSKKAGKESAKKLSKLKSLKSSIFKGLEKVITKIAPEAGEIIAKKGGLEAMTAGAATAVFLIGGAIDGATGAAKLFHIDKSAVDFKMITIASILGAFNGTTTGSVCDLVFSSIDTVLGTQIYTTLATMLYNAWSGGEDSKAGKKLAKAQKKFRDDYLEYQSKEIKSQYEAQKKAGIIGSDVTIEQFIAGVEDGTYKTDYDSEDNYNTKRNGSISDKVMSGVGKGAKALWDKTFGKKTVYEKDGVTYKQSKDGRYHAYKDGEDLGVIAENAIPKDAKKKTEEAAGRKIVKGVGKGLKKLGGAVVGGAKKLGGAVVGGAKKLGGAVVGGAKKLGGAVVGGAKKLGGAVVGGAKKLGGAVVGGAKSVGNFITNPIDTMKDGFNSAKNAVMNTKAFKILSNISKNVGKPVVNYLTAKSDSVKFDCPEDNPGKPIIDTMAKSLQFALWLPHTVIKGGKKIASFLGKTVKSAANFSSASWKANKDYLLGKNNSVDIKLAEDNPLSAISDVIGKANQILLWIPRNVIKGAKKIGSFIGKSVKSMANYQSALNKAQKEYVMGETNSLNIELAEDNPLNAVSGALSKVNQVLLWIPRNVIKGAKKIGSFIGKSVKNIGDAGRSIVSGAKKYVMGNSDTIEMSTEEDNPLNPVASVIGKIGNVLLWGPRTIIKTFKSIGKWIGKNVDNIAEAGTTLINSSKDYISGATNKIDPEISDDNPFKGMIDIVSKVASVLLAPVRIIGKVFGFVGDTVENVKKGAEDVANGIKDKVGDAKDAISEKFKDAGKAAKGALDWATGGFGGRGEKNEEYFSQNDPRWKNSRYGNDGAKMGDSGCGPAAMAMAINTAIDRGGRGVNPMQMAGLAQATGNRDETGTNWNFMSQAPAMMGIGSKQAISPSAEYINNELDSGRPVILSGKTGGFGGRSAFTNAGHYVVATGRDDQGNIIISDPRGKNYSGKYNVSDVARETGSAWTIGGFGKKKKKKKGSATSNGKDWLSIVKACKKSIGDQKKGYSQKGYIDVTVDGKTINTRRDCSGFVSVCLSFYTGKKIITNSTGFESDPNIAKYLKSAGFSKMKWPGFEGTQAGDIYCKGGSHVEICAESGTKRVYNCGSHESCNNPGATNSGHSGYNCIWRPGDPGTGGQDLTTGSSADTSNDATSADSSGSSVFDQLSSAFSNVFSEAQNRLLKGDTNTDFTSVALNGINGNSSNTPSSGGSADTTNPVAEGGKSAKKGETVVLPDNMGTSNTWMGWQLITSPSSMQYKLRKKAGQKFDKNGYGVIDGRYTVATTTTYGKVGDYIDVKRKSGKTLKAIIADIKSPKDAGCNKWGHENGKSVTEFVIDKDKWYHKTNGRMDGYNIGKSTYPVKDNSPVVSITNQGNYFTKGKGGKGGGFGSGPSTITKRNFANTLGYDLGGYGKKKKASREINNKFVTNREARFYRNTNKNSTTDELLYNMVLILSHIAANTKRADNKLADIKSYSKKTASNSAKKKKNSNNNDEITTQNNYYIVKDGTPQLQYTEKKSNSTKADNIAYEIAKGGY